MKRIRKTASLAVFGMLSMLLALPATADAPERWIIETYQPGINPCTGEEIVLETEVLFSEHVHSNTSITHARLLASIGEHKTQLATLHLVENRNVLRVSLREIHEMPDGSKFKVTIVNVLRDGSDPVFTFDARCIRGPVT